MDRWLISQDSIIYAEISVIYIMLVKWLCNVCLYLLRSYSKNKRQNLLSQTSVCLSKMSTETSCPGAGWVPDPVTRKKEDNQQLRVFKQHCNLKNRNVWEVYLLWEHNVGSLDVERSLCFAQKSSIGNYSLAVSTGIPQSFLLDVISTQFNDILLPMCWLLFVLLLQSLIWRELSLFCPALSTGSCSWLP